MPWRNSTGGAAASPSETNRVSKEVNYNNDSFISVKCSDFADSIKCSFLYNNFPASDAETAKNATEASSLFSSAKAAKNLCSNMYNNIAEDWTQLSFAVQEKLPIVQRKNNRTLVLQL